MANKEYRVTWGIELSAESPRKAAETVQQWMRDGETSWMFRVAPTDGSEKAVWVDLDVAEEEGDKP